MAWIEEDVRSLKAQVNQLSLSLELVQSQLNSQNVLLEGNTGTPVDARIVPSLTKIPVSNVRHSTTVTQPHFVGPTSSAFNFNVANSTLQSMGIQTAERESRPEAALPSRCESVEPSAQDELLIRDPLLSIEINEIYRTLELYKEEILPIYPFVSVDELIGRVPQICEYLHKAPISNLTNHRYQDPTADDRKDSKLIKMMIATTLMLESGGKSTLSRQLVDSVDAAPNRSVREVDVDLKELQVFTLTVCRFP